jgi:hypothetical protein
VLSHDSDVMYVFICRPIFGNEYCRSTCIDDFRRQRSTLQKESLLCCFDASNHCRTLMTDGSQARGPAQGHMRRSISLESMHVDKG